MKYIITMSEQSLKVLTIAIVLILLLSEINVISSICFSAPRLSSTTTITTSSEISNPRIQDQICSKILQIGESIEELKSILTITSDDIMNENEESDVKLISKKADSSSSTEAKKNDEKFLSITAKAVRPQFVQLTYFESMKAGAVSRSIAQTVMHPANTYKTLLQLKKQRPKVITLQRLLRGMDAQFMFSVPSGAFQFWVMEALKEKIAKFIPKNLNFLGDLTVSTVSTVICSIFTTPQMVVTDRVMAGVYTDSYSALSNIFRNEGLFGFYAGWAPALAQKIPSYALTWMFFQQMKEGYSNFLQRQTNTEENFILGAIAAAGSVCVMIPMDTVKTRLVIQDRNAMYYKGMGDCFVRIFKEEGIGAFYRSLAPRLMSVVPMIAIQFAVYEAMKSNYIRKHISNRRRMLQQRKSANLPADINSNQGE